MSISMAAGVWGWLCGWEPGMRKGRSEVCRKGRSEVTRKGEETLTGTQTGAWARRRAVVLLNFNFSTIT